MSRPVRILFATYPEAGQLNVHLAVIHSLTQYHKTDVEIHLLTHASGQKRCPDGVIYHEIHGQSMGDILRSKVNLSGECIFCHHEATIANESAGADKTGQTITFRHAPTFFGVLKVIAAVPELCSPNSPSAYISTARAIEAVLELVRPDLIIADPLLAEAADAARRLSMPYIVLSPNAWKDNTVGQQELGAFSWPV